MDLVDRYLTTLRRYLPAGEREDIAREFAANIASEFEEREREFGRPLTDSERAAILGAHGDPIAVAMRYHSTGPSFTFGAQLVGPALFPVYVKVLAANVLIVIAATFFDIPTWVGVSNTAAHVLLQFAIVTIIFASIQRYADRHGSTWQPEKASERRVSRPESIAALVWFLGSNVWLVDLLRTKNLFAPERGGLLVLTPVWHAVVLPYALLVLLEVARNVVNLVRPDMLRFRAIMIVGASVVSFVAIAILLRAGSLVGPSDPGNAGDVLTAHAIDRVAYVSLIAGAVIVAAIVSWQLRFLMLRKVAPPLVATLCLLGLALCTAPAANAAPCSGVPPFEARTDGPQWNGWGAGVSQSRFQPPAMAGLSAARVPKLALRWAFGFPGATRSYGQPTVFGGRVFVGSENHHVYALDARTGCLAWDVDAGAPVRTAITVGRIGTRWAVYFGDQIANAYAVDAATGRSIWKTHVEADGSAIVTGAPTLADGKLYVPVSSLEETKAADASYPCCAFRGSVVALDAATGKTIWQTYTIAATPVRNGTNARGVQRFSPSGAAIWSSPVVDEKRRAVYVATGNSYSDAAAPTSDALLAFDMDSGRVLWSRQMTANDAENIACGLPAPLNANCPASNGPDDDFGASPMLQTLASGQRVLIAGQKSGMVYGVDPDRGGALLWQTRVGAGSKLGGVQWGMAADSGIAYVAVSDVVVTPVAVGTAGSQMTSYGIPFALDPVAGGGLVALDERTGAVLWRTPHPGCHAHPGCSPAQSAAVTAIAGIVFSGGLDGHLRAYAMADGAIVWDVDTERAYETSNTVAATGGSLDGPGATVAGGMLYVDSGYAFLGGTPGNVLLAFSADDA